jgi:hypothetical protein
MPTALPRKAAGEIAWTQPASSKPELLSRTLNISMPSALRSNSVAVAAVFRELYGRAKTAPNAANPVPSPLVCLHRDAHEVDLDLLFNPPQKCESLSVLCRRVGCSFQSWMCRPRVICVTF